MELTWEKWLVMGALAVISVFLGLIPLIILRKNTSVVSTSTSLKYQLIVTSLSCLGGGVLLATCIVHMLVEAREDLASIESIWDNLPEGFALAEILSIIGFILIYLVEEVAHLLMTDSHHHHHHHHEFVRHNSSVHSVRSSIRSLGDVSPFPDLKDNFKTKLEESASKAEEDETPAVASVVRSLLAVIALSFHAIMEGIAVGVQDKNGVWYMFGAIASHKFVISFCMGVELFASKAKLSTYILSIVFFGVISPVGILIGSIISGDTNVLPIAIIKGLATGTLLYVVFFEILNREREKKHHGPFQGPSSKFVGFLQCFSIIVGAVGMTLMLTLTHSHSHDHVDDHEHCHDHDIATTTPDALSIALNQILY